jgi:type IV secretion system protein TrbB
MMASVHDQELRQSSNLTRLAAPLLPYLSERTTLDVVVNADESVWVNRLGAGFERAGDFSVHERTLLLQGIATIRRIAFDHGHPILETIFPLTGDRIEGLISPVVDGAVLAIRTRQKQIFTLGEMTEAGILSNKADPINAKRHHDDFLERVQGRHHLEVIRLGAQYRRNLLLVGPTGSGKTTFANSIIVEWADVTPNDRGVVSLDRKCRGAEMPGRRVVQIAGHFR